MAILLFILIALTGIVSYAFAVYNIHKGNYQPNLFSRAVWFLLNINTLIGILASQSPAASLLLGGILVFGSGLMLAFSIKCGRRHFGTTEFICVVLLALSLIVWLVFQAPLVNVSISLLAHSIGAVPTLRQVWKKPRTESKIFWMLFFVCSALSLIASSGQPLAMQLVPLYYTVFEGSMFLLSLRNLRIVISPVVLHHDQVTGRYKMLKIAIKF